MIYLNKGDIIIRDSVANDAVIIAKDLRQADKDEVYASHHKDPLNALMDGYKQSTLCYTVTFKGEPIAMYGCVPHNFLGDTASIWLLATNSLCNCRRKLLKYDRLFVKHMLNHYPKLSNFIDIRNHFSKRWLSWLGAKFEEAIPYGIEGKLFYPFSFDKESYA
jgi:hypothetical protein